MMIIIITKIKRPNSKARETLRRPTAGQQGGCGKAAPPRYHHPLLQPKGWRGKSRIPLVKPQTIGYSSRCGWNGAGVGKVAQGRERRGRGLNSKQNLRSCSKEESHCDSRVKCKDSLSRLPPPVIFPKFISIDEVLFHLILIIIIMFIVNFIIMTTMTHTQSLLFFAPLSSLQASLASLLLLRWWWLLSLILLLLLFLFSLFCLRPGCFEGLTPALLLLASSFF